MFIVVVVIQHKTFVKLFTNTNFKLRYHFRPDRSV